MMMEIRALLTARWWVVNSNILSLTHTRLLANKILYSIRYPKSSIQSENGESTAINGNAGENTVTEITSINEEESTTPITDNSATNTANHGTVISESETNNYGGFFSAMELDQLQELDISNLIGGGRKN